MTLSLAPRPSVMIFITGVVKAKLFFLVHSLADKTARESRRERERKIEIEKKGKTALLEKLKIIICSES
jgi:hypothetical protein